MVKKLHRSQNDKILAGVCGGLAEYFGLDSTLVRLFFILIVALGGSGILLYALLWLIMPKTAGGEAIITEERVKEFAGEVKERAEEIKKDWQNKQPEKVPEESKGGRGRVFGWVLLILGIAFLANNFMPYWVVHRLFSFWPRFFIVAGVLLIARTDNKK
jgi:phage shock protein PspC (stress-responsive transcriptional regulator)